MERANATEWAKRVERWKDSGLTAKEFAAQCGLKASMLSYWQWKLRAGYGSRGGTSKQTSKRQAASSGSEAKRGTRDNDPYVELHIRVMPGRTYSRRLPASPRSLDSCWAICR